MSAELQWLLTKQSNVHVLNRRNTGTKKLTTEANNVAGVHAFRFSGSVHNKAVGLEAVADNKGAVLTVKRVCFILSLISNHVLEQTFRPIQT
jgi:hypothetical protein